MDNTGLKLADFRNLTELSGLYADLREYPISWSDEFQGWVLSHYDDVKTALTHSPLSNERVSHLQNEIPSLEPDAIKDYVRVLRNATFMTEPPIHTRLRKLTMHCFTPEAVQSWKDLITNIVNNCLDKVKDSGCMDIVADFARPIPATLMADMFNISNEYREDFFVWSSNLANFFGSPFGDINLQARLANEGVNRLEEFFLDLIEKRTVEPGRDLVSYFIQTT